ncbi:MAG: hypothetical protein GC178_04530 [Flavobacteriales bacterium]|nr:hypothetical protein [Flavobacteriales bacterium]
MQLTILYDADTAIVRATPVAAITKENVRKTIQRALKVANDHDCLLLFFDIRKCLLGQSLTQGLNTMSHLMDIPGMTFKHKTAVIFDPERYPTERAEFIENVVNNRANPAFRIFLNEDEAVRWLTG